VDLSNLESKLSSEPTERTRRGNHPRLLPIDARAVPEPNSSVVSVARIGHAMAGVALQRRH
jgi:hypothetical protein